MRRHRGLCAFRARSSGVAAQTKPLCSSRSCSPPLAAGPRPPACVGRSPAPRLGTKSAPHPCRMGGGAGSLTARGGVGWWGGRLVGVDSSSRRPAPLPFTLLGPPPAALAAATPPPVDASSQLAFPFFSCILGSPGQGPSPPAPSSALSPDSRASALRCPV